VVDDYDFRASLIRVSLPANATEHRRISRELPVTQTIGSYGR
jgi:hypothetical protein